MKSHTIDLVALEESEIYAGQTMKNEKLSDKDGVAFEALCSTEALTQLHSQVWVMEDCPQYWETSVLPLPLARNTKLLYTCRSVSLVGFSCRQQRDSENSVKLLTLLTASHSGAYLE